MFHGSPESKHGRKAIHGFGRYGVRHYDHPDSLAECFLNGFVHQVSDRLGLPFAPAVALGEDQPATRGTTKPPACQILSKEQGSNLAPVERP